jgi:AraC family transcriptional regulator
MPVIQPITHPLSQKPDRLYTAKELVMGQMRFEAPCTKWPMHAHQGYMLEFVDQGAMWLLEPGGRRSQVASGQFYVLQPEQEHSQEVDARIRTLYVSLSTARVEEVAREMGLSRRSFFLEPQVESASKEILALLASLAAELAQPAPGTHLLLQSLSLQLIVQLLREQQYGGTEKKLASSCGQISPEVRRALDFIHAHCTEDFSLEQLAASALLSPFYFLRTFKQQTGLTPYAYLRQLRLREAAVLLSQSKESVSAIAARLGFASASHLSAAFRRQYGVTPSQYRAR